MRILVACEFSGAVREAFRALGHDAWSCDLLPAEDGSPFHIKDDVVSRLGDGWDMMIAHPPCTHLAVSGAPMQMVNAPIPAIAVENPICIMSRLYRKPDQIIQPHHFGHAETKSTCLWLKRLPKLIASTPDLEPDFMRKADGSYYTDSKGKRYSRIHFMSGHHGNGCKRQQERSRTYAGIAKAFAAQWGTAIESIVP